MTGSMDCDQLRTAQALTRLERCFHIPRTRYHTARKKAARYAALLAAAGRMKAVAFDASALADTFPKLLMRNARRFGARPSMRHKDLGVWQTWTWADVLEI